MVVLTVLFVHGTGVRQPAYGSTFDRVSAGLAEIRPGLAVAPCYWGGDHGARLNLGGVSIPAGYSTRGVGADLGDDSEDVEIALWSLLEQDPLFELRVLAEYTAKVMELPPNAPPPGADLAAAARRLRDEATVASAMTSVGLGSVFPDVVEEVLGGEPTGAALQREPEIGGALRAALARAFVGASMIRADEEFGGALPLDGATRDGLVAMIVAGLGGSDRGLGRFVVDLALRIGMPQVERRRLAISNAATPVAGDVLMYLARGGPIRDFIGGKVAALPGPVVIVAHSLGGVAHLVSKRSPAVMGSIP